MEIATQHVDDLQGDVDADVAVVIDVIRAFTVAPWCLARGAQLLLLAPDVEAAVQARSSHHPDALLLTDGPPDPRFDLPNAPGLIARQNLHERTVIQVTGNGTRGAFAVADSPVVLCASFATASATLRALRFLSPTRLLLVPTEGDEDVALADFLTTCLDADDPPDPAPYLARVANSFAGEECAARGLLADYPGVHHDDLRRCVELNVFDLALRASPRDDRLLEVKPC